MGVSIQQWSKVEDVGQQIKKLKKRMTTKTTTIGGANENIGERVEDGEWTGWEERTKWKRTKAGGRVKSVEFSVQSECNRGTRE